MPGIKTQVNIRTTKYKWEKEQRTTHLIQINTIHTVEELGQGAHEERNQTKAKSKLGVLTASTVWKHGSWFVIYQEYRPLCFVISTLIKVQTMVLFKNNKSVIM